MRTCVCTAAGRYDVVCSHLYCCLHLYCWTMEDGGLCTLVVYGLASVPALACAWACLLCEPHVLCGALDGGGLCALVVYGLASVPALARVWACLLCEPHLFCQMLVMCGPAPPAQVHAS